jgi:dTMP kinase
MPLFVLEGPDGAGTTKHSALLAERLRKQGHDVVLTAEPTDGPIGTYIRTMLKSPTGDVGALRAMPLPSPGALQLLFCADRADHVARVIQPALDQGKTVITDRYVLSTIVYGTAQGLDKEWLRSINAAFPKPDVMFLLLPPYAVCAERIGRRATKDQFEVDAFQRKVYAEYENARSPEMIVVDTSGNVEEVAQNVEALAQ